MKTYEKDGLRYWWDFHIRFWTVTHIDTDGNQIGTAEYYANKTQLIINYPNL